MDQSVGNIFCSRIPKEIVSDTNFRLLMEIMSIQFPAVHKVVRTLCIFFFPSKNHN